MRSACRSGQCDEDTEGSPSCTAGGAGELGGRTGAAVLGAQAPLLPVPRPWCFWMTKLHRLLSAGARLGGR